MRNLKIRNSKYPKTVYYACVARLAVAAVIAVAACGISSNGNTEDSGHSGAVEVTYETGHGHDPVEEANVHEGGHHDATVRLDHDVEAGALLEITLDAVEGRPWRFEPSVVEVPVGHRVKLTLVNDGLVEHDVEIVGVPANDIEVVGAAEGHERLGGGHHEEDVVAAHAEPGTPATVIFTVTEAGEYEFACTIPGHKEAGMVGKLVVLE